MARIDARGRRIPHSAGFGRGVFLGVVVLLGIGGRLAAAPLELAEVGGALDAENLATAAGATAFGTPGLSCCPEVHNVPHVNDGIYGNSNSWIGETAPVGFVGIALAESTTVASIAFGRDNGGEAQEFTDRTAGRYVLQITTDPAPGVETPDEAWIEVGDVVYDCLFPDGTPWLRHRFNFPPVEATGVRLIVPASGIGGGTAIDELEVYSAPAAVSAVAPGPFLTAVVTGGPLSTPSAPADVPTLEDGNLARAADAVAFGTPPHPAPVHEIAHLRDGIYGNSNSWLGNEPGPASGKVYAGIYFGDGPREIAQLAFGRDNTGAFGDRLAGAFVIEVTLDEFDPADDAATDAATWTVVGAAQLCRGGPLRRLFAFDAVMARALRIVTTLGNVIDEIELGLQIGVPPPPRLALVATGGPTTTPAAAGDVPALADGNLARAADAVPFATPPHPAPVHEIAHLNDGGYGNDRSWLGNEPGASSGDVYAGIYFADGPRTLRTIALGRDNTGAFGDRLAGAYLVQVTGDAFDPADDAAASAASWITVGEAVEHQGAADAGLRRVYCLGIVTARAVRVLTALGNIIDEIELYGLDETPLALVETGGAFDAGNLATEEGAVAFASDVLQGFDVHQIPHLNDGIYGNSNSWIGNGALPAFVGIAFAGSRTVASVAFGRDNGGEAQEFTDRAFGRYVLQYTTVEAPGAETAECDWQDAGQVVIDESGPPSPSLRHRFAAAPFEATGIRLLVPATGIAAGTAIDELEAYSDSVVPNNAPVAIIATSPDPAVVTLVDGAGEATLDGGASHDGDGGAQGLSYLWEKIDGPAGDAIAAPDAAMTAVTFDAPGDYVYRLTVDDGQAADATASAEVTVTVLPEAAARFLRGDANSSGNLDLSDAVFIFRFLFSGGEAPLCPDAADGNGEGVLSLSSGVYILNYLFLGGTEPPAPFPACGVDPTEDDLDPCEYPQELCVDA